LKLKSDVDDGVYSFDDSQIASLLQAHNLFEFHLPIGRIKAGERLKYDIVIRRGQVPPDISWSKISNEFDGYNGYYFEFINIGMLMTEEIFRRGYEAIYDAACAPSDTLFTKQVIPADMVLPNDCGKI
jgi:hypothetical protein